jgi:hypothetical protein
LLLLLSPLLPCLLLLVCCTSGSNLIRLHQVSGCLL